MPLHDPGKASRPACPGLRALRAERHAAVRLDVGRVGEPSAVASRLRRRLRGDRRLAAVVAAKVYALFPNWTAEALALLARVVRPGAGTGVPVRGGNVPGRLPEALSQQIPPGTRPNVGPAASAR